PCCPNSLCPARLVLPVAKADIAVHLEPSHAKRAGIGEPAQRGLGLLATSRFITDNADLESEFGLPACEVVHVAKQASHRRSQAMEDAYRSNSRGGPHWSRT